MTVAAATLRMFKYTRTPCRVSSRTYSIKVRLKGSLRRARAERGSMVTSLMQPLGCLAAACRSCSHVTSVENTPTAHHQFLLMPLRHPQCLRPVTMVVVGVQ